MGKSILLCILLLTASFKGLQSADAEADQQILNCISANAFTNSTIDYVFNNIAYEIRVISNPRHQLIWGSALNEPEDWPLIITSKHEIPLILSRHIQNLIPESLYEDENCFVDLGAARLFSAEEYAELHPIAVAEKMDDPGLDAQIKELFSSNRWANKIVHYHIGDNYYHVRLIHNPQCIPMYAKRQLLLYGKQEPLTLSVTWDYKYGIVTDVEAPQALIDHLSKLVPASWWDWFTNFIIYNGTVVEYEESTYSYRGEVVTTWDTITWFEFMKDPHPKL